MCTPAMHDQPSSGFGCFLLSDPASGIVMGVTSHNRYAAWAKLAPVACIGYCMSVCHVMIICLMGTPVCAVLWDQPGMASGAVPACGLLYMGTPVLQRGESAKATCIMVHLLVDC